MAARLAFEENFKEFSEQSLTRLMQTGRCNDNLMQRARKAFEAFAEYRTLYVDSENHVSNQIVLITSRCLTSVITVH